MPRLIRVFAGAQVIMTPTEWEGDILFLVRILLASVLELV